MQKKRESWKSSPSAFLSYLSGRYIRSVRLQPARRRAGEEKKGEKNHERDEAGARKVLSNVPAYK